MSYIIRASTPTIVHIEESESKEKFVVSKSDWVKENQSTKSPQQAAENIVKRLC